MGTTDKTKRRRDPLSPKPILDRKLLVEALEGRGIYLTEFQLATFYQLLHRQQYPDLKAFVKQYYQNANEENSLTKNKKSHSNTINTVNTNANTNPTETNKENKKNNSNNIKVISKNPISSKKKNLGRHLPKAFLDFLSDEDNDFVTVTSTIQTRPTSKDGTTTKMAIELQDGHVVESVLMRHVSEKGSRATVCVSSQVGCAMKCSFCATGTMGIRGDLCTGEILEQLVHAGRILTQEALDDSNGNNMIVTAHGSEKKKSEVSLDFVRNVVFMGMGEPLNNFNNVIEACRGMIDRRRWNLSHNRVTVSTVGVTPKMRKLTEELPEVNLALSLHAPNQPMREAIVPTAKMYPIEDMVEALDEHMMALEKSRNGMYGSEERKSASKKKRAMIEYVMLEGDTSSFECAHQLGRLCENRHLVVNLIPYNQTDVKDKLRCPSEKHMKEFQRIVTSYGSFCFIRRTMGADIAGACGQLVVSKENQSDGPTDIEEIPFGGKSSSEKSMKSMNKPKIRNKTSPNGKSSDGDNSFDPEKWIRPLAIGTAIAASWLTVSLVMLVSNKRRSR